MALVDPKDTIEGKHPRHPPAKRKRKPLAYPAERIEVDHGVGFSAGDARPSSWVHGFPWLSFMITETEAMSGEIRKGTAWRRCCALFAFDAK